MAEENVKQEDTEIKNEETELEIEVLDTDESIEEQVLDSDENRMESLLAEVEQLQKEKDETYQKFLRSQAEFDNFKKRSQKEKEKERKYKSQDLVNELLPALDNFERALQQDVTEANKGFVDGIKMVYNQLAEALKKQGVEEIATVGEMFDPNLHHAVMQVEDADKKTDEIIEELQKGYILKDRVIRPAMVKVNK